MVGVRAESFEIGVFYTDECKIWSQKEKKGGFLGFRSMVIYEEERLGFGLSSDLWEAASLQDPKLITP